MSSHQKSHKKSTASRGFSKQFKKYGLVGFLVIFALFGTIQIIRSFAAAGLCSTSNVIGTGTYQVNAPEAAQYKLWVRMQVPDTTNTNNVNGVRIELAGQSNQCFVVTTTNSNAVNQWQWINSDATAASTPHITTSLPAGNYTAKILGLKAGVKVDKVLLLRSDSTCTPSNAVSGSIQPGDNCTTPVPTVTLNASPTSVSLSGSSTLTWSSTNATSCTATGGWSGSKATSGSVSTGSLSASTTFNLSCTGAGGSGNASATVTVNNNPPSDTTPPTVTFTFTGFNTQPANNAVVTDKRTVSVVITSSDASGIASTTATINGASTAITNGSITTPNANGNYTISVVVKDNANNTTTKTQTILVRHRDFSRNGTVDLLDLSLMMQKWNMPSDVYDFDDTATTKLVDLFDLSFLMQAWGSTN